MALEEFLEADNVWAPRKRVGGRDRVTHLQVPAVDWIAEGVHMLVGVLASNAKSVGALLREQGGVSSKDVHEMKILTVQVVSYPPPGFFFYPIVGNSCDSVSLSGQRRDFRACNAPVSMTFSV